MPMHDMYNQSVLSLFDPLRTPATPERDAAASPDPSSDKENDEPICSAGQVTAFFNRVHKHHSHAPVKTPKGGLIDYEITVMAPHYEDEEDEDEENDDVGMILDGMDHDTENTRGAEDEEMDVQDENADEDTIQIPLSRRPPLADIQLDSVLSSVPEPEPIPVAGSPETSMWDEGDTAIPTVSEAPAGAPLANVINSINFAGLSLQSPEPSHERSQAAVKESVGVGLRPAPGIAVFAAEPSPSLRAAWTPQRCFGTHLSPSPSTSSLATRRLSPTTSASDPRRTSVDLQSSFRLQLQNADMSFDLLNDKISFLGHDSFLESTDSDPIDFKKEEEAMMIIAEECEMRAALADPDAAVPSSATADSLVFSVPPLSTPSTVRRQSVPSTPASARDAPVPTRIGRTEEDPINITEPSSSRTVESTPEPTSAATVPALRITKKAWKMHDRGNFASLASTASSASSSASSTIEEPARSASRAERIPAKRSAPMPREEHREGNPPVPTMQKARTVVKGLQRPPPGAQLPPMASAASTKMRAVSAGAPRKVGTTKPASATAAVPPLSTQPGKFPTSNFGVTSRLPGISGISKTAASSALRPPRLAGGAVPVRSGLPVPQSRIPSARSALRSGPASRLPTSSAVSRRLP